MQVKRRVSIVRGLRKRHPIGFAFHGRPPTDKEILHELQSNGPNAPRFIGIGAKRGLKWVAPYAHEMLRSSAKPGEISSAAHALASLGYADAIPGLMKHLGRDDGAAYSCAQALATFAKHPGVFAGVELEKPLFMTQAAEAMFEQQVMKPVAAYRAFLRKVRPAGKRPSA